MLTERQAKILRFVEKFQRLHGAPPSTRDVAREFDTAQPTALGHLRALQKKGRLEKLADGRFGTRSAGRRQIEIPLYGAIPAGKPFEAEQETGVVVVDPQLFEFKEREVSSLWALRVDGDSMTGAGIFDGDLAIMIKRAPKPGDVVAALVDGSSTTLKRLARTGGRFILKAANKRFRDILPQSLEVQGVMVGLIRAQGSGA
jgi:repressor LexA